VAGGGIFPNLQGGWLWQLNSHEHISLKCRVKQSKAASTRLRDSLPDQPPELWSAQIDWTHQQGMAELKVKAAQVVLEDELPLVHDLTFADA